MHPCERRRVGMTMRDDEHVVEWKRGLPRSEELTSLSKSLISPVLASAFRIAPKGEPPKTAADVTRESRASFLDLRTQRQRSILPSFDPFPPFKERTDAGAYGFTVEARSDGDVRGDAEGRGDGQGDGSGKSRAGYASERNVDVRGDVRGDCRGDGRLEVRGEIREDVDAGLGLGLGNGGVVSSDRVRVAENQGSGGGCSQGHGGHAMPAAFPTGSDGTSYSEGRSEHSSQGLPFMVNGSAFERRTMGHSFHGSFERRPDCSYGERADDGSKGVGFAGNVRKMPDSDFEDTDSAGGPVNSNEEPNARTLKRPRLVWTPQLHKRFVDAVGHLGIKNAVPKTIMQLMNVEGLTRENVASHLQKYRLYLKRMQGLSSDSPPASDQLFASTPIPPNLGMHFMSNQRGDVGPVGPPSFPSAPVAVAFQGSGPLGPGHLSAYEHRPYGGPSRGLMQRPTMKDRTEHTSESESDNLQSHSYSHSHSLGYGHGHYGHSQNQASSPQKRLLSLFPTSAD